MCRIMSLATIADGGIRMRGAVVEELGEGFHGGLGAVRLLGGKGADGGKERGIDSTGIE